MPNIESVKLYFSQQYISNFSDFININGKNLKNLNVGGYTDGSLRDLFQSIAQNCKNLKDLSILYEDELDQELMEVLNNCIKLKSIRLDKFFVNTLDCDKILTALNGTLPGNLKSITFACKVYNISNHSLDILMKNWRGPKPLTIGFDNYNKYEILLENDGKKILEKYQDLGFLIFNNI